MISTIGVVTSGGDSPGMNAAARAVVRTAVSEGVRIFGIYGGYTGLLDGDIKELSTRSVSDLIQRGGTFLGTGRSKRFHTDEGRKTAMEKLREHDIEGLVVIGGDGSLTGANLPMLVDLANTQMMDEGSDIRTLMEKAEGVGQKGVRLFHMSMVNN